MFSVNDRYAIILAAGKGKRMKSDLPKVLHKLKGKPLIINVLESTIEAGVRNIVIVVGYKKEKVIDLVSEWISNSNIKVNIEYCIQEEQKGTAHAVLAAKDFIPKNTEIIILLGDVPFIHSSTIQESFNSLSKENFSALVITIEYKNPYGYGRIVRNEKSNIEMIVEEKDATPQQKKIQEVNSGIFIFQSNELWSVLSQIDCKNNQGEYYLTDAVKILNKNNKKIATLQSNSSKEFMGINTIEQLNSL